MTTDDAQYKSISRRSHDLVVRCLGNYLEIMAGRNVNELFWVHLVLLCRLTRCHRAIELLIDEGLSCEAASVAVTQFELGLDSKFIGTDVRRATTWVEHENERTQPWSVSTKIAEVYSNDKRKKNGNLQVYEFLSQVKHGNPVAAGFGFPIRRQGDTLLLSTVSLEDAAERFNGAMLITFSSFSLLDTFDAASIAFGQFEPVPSQCLGDVQDLRQEVAKGMTRCSGLLGEEQESQEKSVIQ